MTQEPSVFEDASLPLVSVAIATYNGEAFLEEQLDTIFSQTYPNIEVVVCDDRSTDRTQEILRRYEATKRLRCFVNERNLGVKENFSKAASLCEGDFIAFADQDDVWLPQRIETLLSQLGEGMLIYAPALCLIDQDGQRQPAPGIEYYAAYCHKATRDEMTIRLIASSWTASHQLLFRRELVTVALPIPAAQPCHDAWFTLVASSVGEVRFSPDGKLDYRRHPSSVTYIADADAPNTFGKKLAKMQPSDASLKSEIERLESILSAPHLSIRVRRRVAELIYCHRCRATAGPHFFGLYRTLYFWGRFFSLRSISSRLVFAGQVFFGSYWGKILLFVVKQ